MEKKKNVNHIYFPCRKIFLLCILFVLGMVTLSACGEEKKEVAVLIYDMNDPFINNLAEYMKNNESLEYNITYYDCKNSQIVQNEIAEDLYNEKVDLLIINPVERLSSYIFVRKSADLNIPVIFFNREPLREDLEFLEQAYYVGTDGKESGIMQARLISESFFNDTENLGGYDKNNDHKVQCVILKGEQGHQDAEKRSEAVIDELKTLGYDVEVLATKVANWSESTAYREMDEMMTEHGEEIELLICNNDAMAIGATKYLRDNKYFGVEVEGVVTDIPFRIVGIDGIDEALDLIEHGYMYGTIINDSENTALAIMQLAESILDGTDENLQYELIDDKYILISYKYHSKEK